MVPAWYLALPWPIRTALFLGGGALSATSGRWPEALQDAILFGGLALVVLAIVATLYVWLDARARTRGAKVDPLYLVLFLASLAVAGITGYRLLWPQNIAAATTQSASSAKTGKEGILSLPKVAYSEADISRLLDMLHDAFAFMSGEPSAIDQELISFHNNPKGGEAWYTQIEKGGAQKYIERLEVVLERSQKMWAGLNDFVYRSKHSHYKDQVRVALNLDMQPDGFHTGVSRFVRLLKLLPAKPEHNTLRIMDEPFGNHLDINRTKWREWVGGSLARIESMTESLRKNGTTGFEKK